MRVAPVAHSFKGARPKNRGLSGRPKGVSAAFNDVLPPIRVEAKPSKALPREGESPPQAAAALCYLQKKSGASLEQARTAMKVLNVVWPSRKKTAGHLLAPARDSG